MNYQGVVSWMFQQLPMYQNQGASAYKTDLSNTLKLSKHLDYPERQFKSIHVGGTNGKGSVSHMLASILQEAGYKVGLHTSPHLKDYRERIRINGEVISKQFVVDFVGKNKPFFETNKLSFFEMTVGMAFDYFSKQEIDIAIIEVGLGGRLDSTNIITPELSVITNIGFDHMEFLGKTLDKIALEKAGIIKQGVPVVIGETQPLIQSIFIHKAKSLNADLYFADQLIDQPLESDLKGSYQSHNIKTVLQSVKVLKRKGFQITDTVLRKGLLHVTKNTGLLGRWQVLGNHPKIICDTAHNKEGLSLVIQQLLKETFSQLHIVFGVVKDKDLNSILGLLPNDANYYFCKPNVPRGLDAEKLKSVFAKNDYNGKAYESVRDAYQTALSLANKDDLIFIGGSTFVVAEII